MRRKALALVNAHRVPSSLADPFVSGVNALGEQTPVCLPPVRPTAPTAPPAVVTPTRPHGHDGKHGRGHGKHGGEGD
ncbi:MAG: hypothetical protein ACJ76I_11015 [Gaiellaceae bacterium]